MNKKWKKMWILLPVLGILWSTPLFGESILLARAEEMTEPAEQAEEQNTPVFSEEEKLHFLELLNEKKRELYYEEYPEQEDEGDQEKSRRRLEFVEDAVLNEAADHRLAASQEKGYADGSIPGEGEIGDYLSAISYRSSSACLEFYLRGCEDTEEAYEEILEKLDWNYDKKRSRKYSLEYYHRLGTAGTYRDGKLYLMVILMR